MASLLLESTNLSLCSYEWRVSALSAQEKFLDKVIFQLVVIQDGYEGACEREKNALDATDVREKIKNGVAVAAEELQISVHLNADVGKRCVVEAPRARREFFQLKDAGVFEHCEAV